MNFYQDVVIEIARNSDNPTVIAALQHLLLACQIAHTEDIEKELSRMARPMIVDRENARRAVEIAMFNPSRSSYAALENLLDVTRIRATY